MVIEYIRYRISEDQRGRFEAAYREARQLLEASPHCLAYELSRGVEEPACYMLRIEWDSVEGHMERFRRSEFRAFFQHIRPFVRQIEEMQHYEVASVAGVSAPEDAVKYELTWNYSDVKPGNSPPDPEDFDVHFELMLRFPNLPPGEGHTEHFCFNVLSRDAVEREDISTPTRGFMGRESFSYDEITETVERSVADAFSRYDHERALEVLNEQYVREGLDFSAGFEADLRDPRLVLDMIHRAFDGVERGRGITLHEATVIDDYGSEEEQRKARELDQETRWQDVPDSTIAGNFFLGYLDMEGYRYYLPALMSWSIRNDHYGETYGSLLPLVAPRDVGRGHGERFDVQMFIKKYSFTPEQVQTIYFFLVLAVVQGRQKVEEDHYPAMLKWKKAALGEDCP